MKNIVKTLLVLGVISFGASPLLAGSNHDHGGHSHDHGGHSHEHEMIEISKADVLKVSKMQIDKLIEKNKIDASWEKAKLIKTEQKKFNSKKEWVVSYKNENIKDVNKQTIYVFIDLNGDVQAANYSGN